MDALALLNLHLADVVGAHGAVDGEVALRVVELARSIRQDNCSGEVYMRLRRVRLTSMPRWPPSVTRSSEASSLRPCFLSSLRCERGASESGLRGSGDVPDAAVRSSTARANAIRI